MRLLNRIPWVEGVLHSIRNHRKKRESEKGIEADPRATCVNLREGGLLDLYRNGSLSLDDNFRVQVHLEICPECRRWAGW